MRFEEKLRKEMLHKGFNQQKLARASRVSDSEISRILGGKSQPGLENALRLARAVEVSLDYLADDTRESDDLPSDEKGDPLEEEILEVARDFGNRKSRHILETVRDLGYDVAIRRLLELKPLIEVGDPQRDAAVIAAPTDRRASSA